MKTVYYIFFFIVLFTIKSIDAQVLQGMKKYTLMVVYTEEAEKIKNYIPDEYEIKTKIEKKIKGLKEDNSFGSDVYWIDIYYNIYRDFSPPTNYYVRVNFYVKKQITDCATNIIYYPLVYDNGTYFSILNESDKNLINSIKGYIDDLILNFKKEYYKFN